MTGEATLVGTTSCLASVDLHTNLCEGGLEHQLDLSAVPLLRQGELMLVLTCLISNALWGCLAIETHAILISAEALQLPA